MRQTANLGVVQYSGIWRVPNAVSQAALNDGCVNTVFTWGAPQNNGGPILKYGYQVSLNDGPYGPETETTGTSYSVSTQYSTDKYKIRVRAFTAAGWGPYSTVSSENAPWVLETEITDDVFTETVTGTDTENSSDTETETINCNCGTQSRTRTRSKSRSRTRTETRTKTRTKTRTRLTKSGCTAQAWSGYTYGEYGAWSAWSYGAWSAYGAWTYGAWGAWGAYGACSGTGTWTSVYPFGDTVAVINGSYSSYVNFSAFGPAYSDAAGNWVAFCAGGSGAWGPVDVQQCSTTLQYQVAGGDQCIIPSCC